MQPVSGQPPINPRVRLDELPRAVGRRAPTAVAAPRDELRAAEAATAPSLVELLGRVPAAAARVARPVLLPPPAGDLAMGFAAVSSALRGAVQRGSVAGRIDDPLWRAVIAAPHATAMRAAIERERRLVEAVAELCGMRDEVAAGMAAVAVG